jgi:hypothetical protein
MQHLEGSGTPVLYIGRKVLKFGRPKLRWEDDVLEDIKSMKVCNCQNLAQDRERWKKVVEQATTLNRL